MPINHNMISRAPTAAADGTSPSRSAPKQPGPASSVLSAAKNAVKPGQSDPDMIMLDTKQVSQPMQMLMDTPITIEYGANLSESRTIHEGMLLRHSKQLEILYTKARALRKGYASCKKMSEDVELLLMQDMSAADVAEGDTEEEIIELITKTCESYPIIAGRALLRKEISNAVNEQIEQKNTKSKRKETRETALQPRLTSLDHKGLHAILGFLSVKIRHLKSKEKESAKKDSLKAAAQARLILPDENGKTIQSLMAWIYQGMLNYDNADQLYAIFRLASKLGIDALAETCLDKLCNDASKGLQQARSQNHSLQYLLGYGISSKPEGTPHSVPVDNVVAIVFKHVTQDEHPPKRLLQIFVDAMAESLDVELWALLKDVLHRDKMAALIQAMLVRQVKTERSAHVKSEGG